MASLAGPRLGAAGANLLVMDGEVAFQDVPHFHIHVIRRYAGDGFGLTFPKSYETPPGRAELETIAAAIRAAGAYAPYITITVPEYRMPYIMLRVPSQRP